MRTTNDGIWDWDLTKNSIEWNLRAHKIFGKATAELISTPELFLELIHPDDQETVRTAFQQPYIEGPSDPTGVSDVRIAAFHMDIPGR